MKRLKILELIEMFHDQDYQQRKYKKDLMTFVKGNSNCFDSNHPPVQGNETIDQIGHVTGSAWVLSPDRKAVLLTHRKKLNKWLQLGGHSDGESDLILTSLREAKEESGIDDIYPLSGEIFDIDVHTFPKKKDVDAHLHYDIRFCLQAKSYYFLVSNEAHNLKWIPLLEITTDLFEESIVRMAQKTGLFLTTRFLNCENTP